MHHLGAWSAVVLLAVLAGHAGSAAAQSAAQREYRQQTITCSSDDNRRQTCRVDGWADAELLRQISDTRCERGRNWGFQQGAVWVDNGCRATFGEVRGRRDERGTQQTVTCSSDNNRRQNCRVPGWYDATLVRQISDTRCVRGQNWGMQNGVLWVDNGCRGTFAEARGNDHYRPGDGSWQPGPGWDRQIVVNCASKDDRYQMCRVDIGPRGSVRLQRQDSRASCVRNRTWGFNRAGVWVDQGCRGRFIVDRRW